MIFCFSAKTRTPYFIGVCRRLKKNTSTAAVAIILKKFPIKDPQKMNGKVYSKIKIKSDFMRSDGTCALFLYLRVNKQVKKLPLQISCDPKKFNFKDQRIIGSTQTIKDYNILIGKALADINEITLSYRLRGVALDLKTLINEYQDPSPNFDFLRFYERELEKQKKFIANGTYRQQKSTLTKLKKYKSHIPFSVIDENFIKELKLYSKNTLKNAPNTISTTLKNFKKYLHLANRKGINTAIIFEDIKVTQHRSNRTFLDKEEIQKLYKYWCSEFINDSHKNVLSKFLFSVFTSLRISDIQIITRENIISDFLVYNSKKTDKINKINLSESAKKFIQPTGPLFLDSFTPEYINRELKNITRFVGIKKKVSFHVARHSFATNFIISGGNVVNLQKLMDHSNIRETMIYVHTVNAFMNEEVHLLNDLLN